MNYRIFYRRDGNGELRVYTDSEYAGDVEDREYKWVRIPIKFWCSVMVFEETTNCHFVDDRSGIRAAAVCTCQAIWIRRVLHELRYNDENCTHIWCDNSFTIKLSKNPVMHGRSKHIDVRYHFLRNLTSEGLIDLVHCVSKDQLADIMTKPLKADDFQKLRGLLGVYDVAVLS